MNNLLELRQINYGTNSDMGGNFVFKRFFCYLLLFVHVFCFAGLFVCLALFLLLSFFLSFSESFNAT